MGYLSIPAECDCTSTSVSIARAPPHQSWALRIPSHHGLTRIALVKGAFWMAMASRACRSLLQRRLKEPGRHPGVEGGEVGPLNPFPGIVDAVNP